MVLALVALGIILSHAEPDVRLFVQPYGQRVPVCDKHPLPDVELSVLHYQGVLDALLDHPKSGVSLEQLNPIDDLVEGLVELDTPAS